jgi:N-terminal acetyltransferase B complex non-catalytic subunit
MSGSQQLTTPEAVFYDYCYALADWLGPHHDWCRPPPAQVLANASKANELKTGHPLKGFTLSAESNGAANGHVKKEEDAPPVKDAPSITFEFFDGELAFRTLGYVD